MNKSTLPASLTERMALSAHGYAAVIDGIMNVRTVSSSPNFAALNALYLTGKILAGGCRDPECDCMVNFMKKVSPNIKIVPVSVHSALFVRPD
ncbi:hypothetical protein [Roseicitreum antarcticum]|uniref:Uncharacterized protein n=1 Tax=Roseicitreum antarcticum TaxID=564137 RepID=A0A1H3G0H0_9RHOB|nr:hypothetical protein [Roseicitreum antarcticum]SDX96736.1 hypothetical protein SAMN04488238_1572 [Roseicitreum antarcticum]